MVGLGVAGLWVALVAATATVMVGPSARRLAALVAAAALAVSTISLGRALWTLDLRLVYVADHARGATSAPYRLAGLWGGASGSLLLFTAMVAILVAILVRGESGGALAVGAARWGGATVAGLVVAVLWLADPFVRLAIPAIEGGGLQPILEHPAMLYHPPILYVGLVSTFVPFVLVTAPGGLRPGWRQVARRSLGASLAILTAGLATGANWAYVELGWGGYWGWDPVENGVLVPWLMVIAALHGLRQPGYDRWLAALCAAPWIMVLVGTTVTRSGIGGSVHAFADDERLGWMLLGCVVVTLIVAIVQVARVRVTRRKLRRLLLVNLALTGVAAFVVTVGVLYPIPAAGEPLVSGHFYATLLGPIAAVALGAAALALGRVTRLGGLASATAVTFVALAIGARSAFSLAVAAGVGILAVALAGAIRGSGDRRVSWATRTGHIGLAMLLIGVAGSTEGERVTVTLDPGEEITVGSQVLRHVGVEVVANTDATSSVVATIELLDDGEAHATLVPELVAYPERSVLLAESALRSTPRRDVQVVLRSATDAGTARYDISVVPLTWWVWWGAVGIAVAGALVVTSRVASPMRARVPEPISG